MMFANRRSKAKPVTKESPSSTQLTIDHPLAVGPSDKKFVTPRNPEEERMLRVRGALAAKRAKWAVKTRRERGITLDEALEMARREPSAQLTEDEMSEIK